MLTQYMGYAHGLVRDELGSPWNFPLAQGAVLPAGAGLNVNTPPSPHMRDDYFSRRERIKNCCSFKVVINPLLRRGSQTYKGDGIP